LPRPVQRVLQGTHLIPRNNNASAVGGTSQTGTHRAPPATSARLDEVVALPSPAVMSSARLNRYYNHLPHPSGWLPLPGSSPVIGHRAPPRPCAAGWAGEDLSSSRRHYLSVPQPLTPGSPSAPAHPGLQRLPWPSPFTAELGTPSSPPTGRVISRRGRPHFTLRTAQLHTPQDWGARRWASTPPVSRRHRQPATGPPGCYPDRTHTGKRRRAYETKDQPLT
jgi:hypothetical protein